MYKYGKNTINKKVKNLPYNYIESFVLLSHLQRPRNFQNTNIRYRKLCQSLNRPNTIWHNCWPSWYRAVRRRRRSAIAGASFWRTPQQVRPVSRWRYCTNWSSCGPSALAHRRVLDCGAWYREVFFWTAAKRRNCRRPKAKHILMKNPLTFYTCNKT